MTDLATQIEQAAPEMAMEMLLATFKHCLPQPSLSAEHFDDWSNVYVKFYDMINAEAWTSAAELFVPEGANYGCGHDIAEDNGPPGWAWVGSERIEYTIERASLPGLALAAACVRARG